MPRSISLVGAHYRRKAWFYDEGTSLPVEMEYDLTLAKEAYELASRWDAARSTAIDSLDFKSTDLDGFDSNQKGA